MTWLAYSHLGVAKTVQLTTQPAVALAGIPFGVQPVGRLVDGSGVLSRATGVTVTASKAGGTGTLSGTLSVQTVEGVFTFTDLKMDTVTSAVTLSFASSGLTSATSSAFNVTQPNTIIGCEVGTYTTTGTDATFARTRVCQCVPGSYVVTGTNTGLNLNGLLGTVLFTETFADSSFASRGWYDLSSTDWVASPAPSGMSGALRMTFTAGQTNASTRTMRKAFTATDHLYVKYQQSFSSNWVGSGQLYHPHLVMCLSDQDDAYAGPSDNYLAIYSEVNYQSGNRPAMKFQDNQYVDAAHIGTNFSEARATCGANGQQGYADSWDLYADGGVSHGWYNSRNLLGAVAMAAGNTAWHTVEFEVILNTVTGGIGQTDGICRYWWDGVLVWERTNLIMRTGTRPTLKMNQFLFTPYIGDGSPVTQSTYIGDLTVATARPSSIVLYANKPSGYTTSRTLNFSQSVPGGIGSDRTIVGSQWSLIYDTTDGAGSSAAHITDGTAPVDSDVWRMHFAPGTFGSSHGVGVIYTGLPGGVNHLYVSLVFKYSDGYPYHGTSNKFLWWSASNGDPYFIQSKAAGDWMHHENNGSNQFLDNHLGLLQGATLLTYKNDPLTDGWHQIESILDLSAGTWKTWIDGDMKMNATGVLHGSGATFIEFLLEAYRGGGGETLAVDCYNYWDNLHLAW